MQTEAKIFEDLVEIYYTWCTSLRLEPVDLIGETFPRNKLKEFLHQVFTSVEEAHASRVSKRYNRLFCTALIRVDRRILRWRNLEKEPRTVLYGVKASIL